MTVAKIDMAPKPKPGGSADPFAVFVARGQAKARLVREGDLDLHEAVDALQAAAVQTGLTGALGQDAVQAIMNAAFAAVHKPALAASVPEPTSEAAPAKRAAASTVEALMYSLRERGAAALSEKPTQRRLAELCTDQIRIVIERLIAARARYRAIDDELLFLLGEQLA